jgi:hypothetical protein
MPRYYERELGCSAGFPHLPCCRISRSGVSTSIPLGQRSSTWWVLGYLVYILRTLNRSVGLAHSPHAGILKHVVEYNFSSFAASDFFVRRIHSFWVGQYQCSRYRWWLWYMVPYVWETERIRENPCMCTAAFPRNLYRNLLSPLADFFWWLPLGPIWIGTSSR